MTIIIINSIFTADMYTWSEDVASRGGEEIGSCIKEHLGTHTPEETERIILYSDRCGAQNRNIKLTLMLKKFLSKHDTLISITQKYFVPGLRIYRHPLR